ncbi:uncharacterized protein GIQ15_04225 [Arthroderma uncinatum]|uniref:uncharacterized protein n=1 Tax=Arthroderma uncinatum TaxID=74035 RepID=UPI00144AC44B|nr:uncharacterized protein GIQ15_04225 [Arthroderma uncinatum]KAF3481466.1 hypothetical protein GIQ15_04225 [Arthroderma uncinatum]
MESRPRSVSPETGSSSEDEADDWSSPKNIEAAKEYNPRGLSAIEFGMARSKFYYKYGLVAGYLKNCCDTQELRRIVDSLSDLFKQYDDIRQASWKSTISCRDLFKFLRTCEGSPRLCAAINSEEIPSIEAYTSDEFDCLVTCNILVKVINRVPEHFAEVYEYSPMQKQFLPLFEDIHRAYALLRTWYKLNEKRTTGLWGPRKPQNKPAIAIHYFDELDDASINNVRAIDTMLSRASMPLLPLQQAATMLKVDVYNPTIFADEPSGLALLRPQLIGVATMLHQERISWDRRSNGQPTRQACILADQKGIGEGVEVYSLVWLSYTLGIQSEGDVTRPIKPTLICIEPDAVLRWRGDYIQYFQSHLRVFFVSPFVKKGNDPFSPMVSIGFEEFYLAMTDPEKSPLFPSLSDRGRTAFIITHKALEVYIYESRIEHEKLEKSNLHNDDGILSTQVTDTDGVATEAEDAELQAETAKFDTFFTKYHSPYAGSFYRIVVDGAHVLRLPKSRVSRAIKLLDPDFTWLMTATPLPDGARDFYGYSLLLYNKEWVLDLPKDFMDADTIRKFEYAKSYEERLELFNPLYIHRLSVNGQIDASDAASPIPVLLKECMIRRTCDSEPDVGERGRSKKRSKKQSKRRPKKQKREYDMREILLIKGE